MKTLIRLALGAVLMAGASLAMLLVTRFLSVAELRDLFAMIRSRGAPAVAAGSSG